MFARNEDEKEHENEEEENEKSSEAYWFNEHNSVHHSTYLQVVLFNVG